MNKRTSGGKRIRGKRETPYSLADAVKRMITTLTIPSVLSGCAHQIPAPSPPVGVNMVSSKKVFTVFRRKPVDRGSGTNFGESPELDAAFSEMALIDSLLARKSKAASSPKPKREVRMAAARPKPLEKRRGAAKAAAQKAVAEAPQVPAQKQESPLQRLRGRLLLAGIEHERVAAQIEELRHHPAAVPYLLKRAEPFLPYLVGEVDRSGLPADTVFVPMVESGFETTALSPKQAGGIWQFMPSTGEQYGLKMLQGYDGRYDIHAATQAAFAYIKHLNAMFKGDWLLTLAAYNAGEGAVKRALEASLKAGKEASFWELDLPDETEKYVPRIVALAHVIADPESYGFKLPAIGDGPRLACVEVKPEVSIAEVLAASGMPQDEFFRLNAAFKPDLPPPPDTYSLLLPVDKAEPLAVNLPGARLLGTQRIVVKKGDTLAVLAKRHGVPAQKLAQWNKLAPKSALKPGQELLILPV